MTDFLNSLGLPMKYAILCGLYAAFGMFLVELLGLATANYVPTAIGGMIGGVVAGIIRKRRGKTN